MAVCDYNQQIDSIKKLVIKNSYHPYLNKYIQPPELDEDQIYLLSFSLQDSGLPKLEREIYISSAILANFALKIHENVASNEITLKERQLKVLAGDFYSGMYYQLLAEYQNIELIKVLSDAIRTINEHKINLYSFQGENLEAFMDSVVKVESSILTKFCSYFQISVEYITFISEFLFFKRLLMEIDHIKSQKQTLVINGLKQYIQNHPFSSSSHFKSDRLDMNVLFKCYTYASKSKEKLVVLLNSISTLPAEMVVRINELFDQFQQLSSQFVEEK